MSDPDRREDRPVDQYGVLPFRRDDRLEVLPITARGGGRWVIPKGWPMKGRKPREAAAREALEEAGVSGVVGPVALGTYAYAKRLAGGARVRATVRVFPLEVRRERAAWPEMGQRDRRWFSVEDAAAAVAEPELRRLILSFGENPLAR